MKQEKNKPQDSTAIPNLKDYAEKWSEIQGQLQQGNNAPAQIGNYLTPTWPYHGGCPACGYCPHCGRGGSYQAPYQPIPIW